MTTNKFLLLMLALLLVCSTAQAQFGKRLGKAIENAAKSATVRKAEQKTEEAVSKTIDKATDPDTYKDKDGGYGNDGDVETSESGVSTKQPQQGVKAAEMAYAKSDFVPGDEIIFEDNQVNEQLGEFPSMWDLIKGNAEIAGINGESCIIFDGEGTITPLMKDMNSYLPEEYTIELDFWLPSGGSAYYYIISLNDASTKRNNKMYFRIDRVKDGEYAVSWNYTATSGGKGDGKQNATLKTNAWHHWAMSFNKRAFKAYIDGVRVVSIPNMAAAANFNMYAGRNSAVVTLAIRNVRIAKGAVPLYDRMMSEGKIITYGITFDVGKSTIKPESMGEINRIATLMKDNPGLKFSVEGHTDSTGSAANNQKLSDERSAAVVAKLAEMGVAKDRLSSAGKGQTSPIADNSTDEGRAKNRRVEFVKIN